MSDRNNDQELEKTTDATADEVTSETETNDAIESVPADSMQFSVTFDDVDDEGTVDDGIYSALASAETGETDETSEAEADAIASANASAEVTERNAARVNETLRLAKTDHKDALAEHAEPQGKASEPTMTLASRIDRVLVGGGSDDILLKTYPTFALNKVTVAGPKGKVNILDGANFFCYSGHAYALLISDDPDSGITADAKRRALMGVMSGLTTPASGTVMNKSANIVELEPVELRGHRLGIVPQLHAVQPKLDAEQNVLYAMNASNRNFLKPKPVIARELLAKVGFSEATSGVAVGTLPLVQQRLVAIARAISTEAEVLILDEDENELILPKAEQIPNDFYRKGDTIKAIVKAVEMNNNQPRIILSRTANQFLERLFEQEVPEIFDGLITIKKIVRIPGERAKVAVESYDERIDPVGACVGMKGSRIYSIVKELRNENIDVVNYTANPTLMIQRSLNPAKVSSITIDEEKMTASVYLKPDQVSLAIGKGGLNIRLSKMLTGYDIDVYREVEEEDVALTEFADEIDGWVIDALKAAGCDTAKSVLELPVEEIAARADLELEQAQKVVEILKAEFE